VIRSVPLGEHAPQNAMDDPDEIARFYDRATDLMRALLDGLATAPDRPRAFPVVEDALGWPHRRIASVLGGAAHMRHMEFAGRRPYRFLPPRFAASGRWELWMDARQAEAVRAEQVAAPYRGDMPAGEKPTVEVPADQPPSYQLELEDLEIGEGEEATTGRVVEVHYVGVSWSTGRQFDASWDRGSTFTFGLGRGQVIPGWDQGVAGMRVGGRRRITIPPMLGYGKRGAGGVIGPDETLVFVVDLVGVR
jgi:peptidylprolyl isomerase